ncbi:MAG: S8 family serine peptidase [Nanoarchaeota archaeon]
MKTNIAAVVCAILCTLLLATAIFIFFQKDEYKATIPIVAKQDAIFTVPASSTSLRATNTSHSDTISTKNILDGKKNPIVIEQRLSQAISNLSNETVSIVINTKDKDEIKKKGIGKVIKESKESILVELPVKDVPKLVGNTTAESVEENDHFFLMLTDSAPLVGANVAWQSNLSGVGSKIAIIDTGIDVNHEVFPQGKIIAMNDFTDSGSIEDVGGHGTHVAGIAAGNSSTIMGIAPGALLLVAKVFRRDSSGGLFADTIDVTRAIEWATDLSADVISMSLGSPTKKDSILNAIKRAHQAGIVVVAAAGNCGPCPSASCNGYQGITYPAGFEQVIAVGATTKNDELTCFSSQGPIDNLIKPDVVAPGSDILSASPRNRYIRLPGTSMAAPHVAGAVALLKQRNPLFTPTDIIRAFEVTSKDLGPKGKDPFFGFGRIDLSRFSNIDADELIPFEVLIDHMIFPNNIEQMDIVLSQSHEKVSAYGIVTRPDQQTVPLLFSRINNSVVSAQILETSLIGVYVVEVNLTIGDLSMLFQRSFEVVTPTGSIILDAQVNTPVGLSGSIEGVVTLKSPVEGNVTVEMEVSKQKAIKGASQIILPIESNKAQIIRLNISGGLAPGDHEVRFVTIRGPESSLAVRNLTVIDDLPPSVLVDPEPFNLTLGMPATLHIGVMDHLVVNGSFEVFFPDGSIKLVEGLLNSGNIFGTVIASALGTYSYKVLLCDSAGNCAWAGPYLFKTIPCSKDQILVIHDDQASLISSIASEYYCVGELDRRALVDLPIEILNRFPAVIWDADTSKESVVVRDVEVLDRFLQENRSLILTGSNIAYSQSGSAFAQRVFRNSYSSEFFFLASNESPVSISIKKKHPITKNLPLFFVLNSSRDPSPDRINPSDGGVGLASYSTNASAIVAFEDQWRIVFISFAIKAMPKSIQNVFVQDMLSWAMERPSIDYQILNMSTSRFPVKGEPFSVLFSTNAPEGSVIEFSVPGMEVQRLLVHGGIAKADLTLDTSTSIHASLEVWVPEKNYLNNEYSGFIDLAGKLPDFTTQFVKVIFGQDTANVTTLQTNKGGSWAGSTIRLRTGQVTSNMVVSLGPGESSSHSWILNHKGPHISISGMIDSFHEIDEGNETNNGFEAFEYRCVKERVLVVIPGNKSVSSDLISDPLKQRGYCVDVARSDKEELSEALQKTDVVVWWQTELVNTSTASRIFPDIFSKQLLLLGENVGSVFASALSERGIAWDSAQVLEANTTLVLADPLFLDTNATLAVAVSPKPDSWYADHVIATYNKSGVAAAAVDNGSLRLVVWGFPIDAIVENESRKDLIVNSVRFLAGNHPPLMNVSGNLTVFEGGVVWIVVNASDPDGEALVILANDSRLNHSPLNITILNYTIHEFFWTPSYDDAGSYTFRFSATDRESTAFQDVNIVVMNVNRAPLISGINVSVKEGENMRISLNISDPDNDTVILTVNDSRFTLNKTELVWTTKRGDAGIAFVKITATDSSAVSSAVVQVKVVLANHPPLIFTHDVYGIENESLRIFLNASDLDGDDIIFSLSNAPLGMIIEDKMLVWSRPVIGFFNIIVVASDRMENTSAILSLVIRNAKPVSNLPILVSRFLEGSEIEVNGTMIAYVRVPKEANVTSGILVLHALGQAVIKGFVEGSVISVSGGDKMVYMYIPKQVRVENAQFLLVGSARETGFIQEGHVVKSTYIDDGQIVEILIPKIQRPSSISFRATPRFTCTDYETLTCPYGTSCPISFFRSSCVLFNEYKNTLPSYQGDFVNFTLPKIAQVGGAFIKLKGGQP